MPQIANHLTIAELEQILYNRRKLLVSLSRKRDRIKRRLILIENKIRRLSGTGAFGLSTDRAGRARNVMSLLETLSQVLKKGRKPMSVSDIYEGVLATGYNSTSPNFRAIVNMTLIKDRKRFKNTGRGMYELSK